MIGAPDPSWYTDMVNCAWNPGSCSDSHVPGATVIIVNCRDTFEVWECQPPSQAVEGSLPFAYGNSVAYDVFVTNGAYFKHAKGGVETITKAYAAIYGAILGGAAFVESIGEAGAITDPLIANSDKVLAQVAPDTYHAFGELIGQEAMQWGELTVQNGSYLQWNIPGFVNGVAGVFEYGGLLSPTGGVLYITHTFFSH
jgi:hypothetical protein